MFFDELNYYNELKSKALSIGKPCIWSIVSILMETENKTINITALVSKLNSNYDTVTKCINHMKNLNLVEEIRIGRLKLIKLLDNDLTQLMINVIEIVKKKIY